MNSCIRAILLLVLIFTGCGTGDDAPSLERAAVSATLTSDGMVTLPATGWGDPGVVTSAVPAGWAAGSVAWCCSNWWVPIPVAAGDVVGSVAALVHDVAPDPLYIPGSQGDGGSSVVLSLIAQNGTTQTVLRSIGSNGSGAQQSLIMTLTSPYTVPAGATLLLKANAFALWPSSVMHPSVVGPVTTAAPTQQSQFSGSTETYSIGFASPGFGVQMIAGDVDTNASMSLGTSTAASTLPLRVQLGRPITAWSVRFIKNSTSGTIAARLLRSTPGGGGAIQVGTTRTLSIQSVASIGESSLNEQPVANAAYFISVRGGGTSGDFAQDYQLTQ